MDTVKATLQTRNCANCGRVFAVLTNNGEVVKAVENTVETHTGSSKFLERVCRKHCGVPCCRAANCPNAKPAVRSVRSTRTCSVCHRPRWMFVRFAPCSDQCTLMRYRSTRRQICMIHRPVQKARIHIDYCSLEHYNDWEKGHRERMLGGRRVRWRRHRDEKLSQERFRREKARR